MTSRVVLLVMLAVSGLVGCAPARAPSVAATSRSGNPTVSSFLGQIERHGTPGHPDYDPERAYALLDELLARHPRGSHVQEGRARLALLAEVIALRTELRRLKEIDLRAPAP